jgi:hypothetical protein
MESMELMEVVDGYNFAHTWLSQWGGGRCNLKRNGVTQPYTIPLLHGPCKDRLPFGLELERGVVRCAEGKDGRDKTCGCQKLF